MVGVAQRRVELRNDFRVGVCFCLSGLFLCCALQACDQRVAGATMVRAVLQKPWEEQQELGCEARSLRRLLRL